MEYRISKKNDSVHITVLGPLNRNAVHSVSGFIRPFLKGGSTNISIDIDDLKDEHDMVFNIGLINAFKKEIEQAGGHMRLKSKSRILKNYLNQTGMGRLFGIIL
jgi:anti-anti-sigma factor